MDLQNEQPRRRNSKEISYDFKISVLKEIANGQIYLPQVNQFASLVSANFASKKYNISRSTLDYWKKKLMDKNNIKVDVVDSVGTIIYVSKNNEYVGYLIIKDRIKDDSKDAIKSLRNIGVSHIVMLTGDNEKVARQVGDELDIKEVISNTLPDQKVEVVQSLLDKDMTSFVGDGINDAPVLTLSDVGIAMGAMGSDAAIEAADVVIMDDKISKIPVALKQSKKTMNIIVSNIIFAIGVKLLVLLLSAFGYTNMWLAIFADVGVSVLCILNSIRLLKIN